MLCSDSVLLYEGKVQGIYDAQLSSVGVYFEVLFWMFFVFDILEDE